MPTADGPTRPREDRAQARARPTFRAQPQVCPCCPPTRETFGRHSPGRRSLPDPPGRRDDGGMATSRVDLEREAKLTAGPDVELPELAGLLDGVRTIRRPKFITRNRKRGPGP